MKLLGMVPQMLEEADKKKLSNWVVLSGYIYEEDVTPQELINMLYFEVTHKRRFQIIDRLHSRFNKVRVQTEKEELICLLNESPKKTLSNTSSEE